MATLTAPAPAKVEKEVPKTFPIPWDRQLRRMMDDMERWMGWRPARFNWTDLWTRPETTQWVPDVEIVERKGQLVVKADLPGMKPEDVKVEFCDGVLTLQGERKYEHEEEKEGVYRSERSYGSFSRSIELPEGVIGDQINARFVNGVLELTMPLPKAILPERRKIDVKTA